MLFGVIRHLLQDVPQDVGFVLIASLEPLQDRRLAVRRLYFLQSGLNIIHRHAVQPSADLALQCLLQRETGTLAAHNWFMHFCIRLSWSENNWKT
jgi:hypothetical protein